jgi:ABC-type lipoprotein export system ATPase subunit
LELENVTKQFPGVQGPVRALQDVNLRLDPGDFVSVWGPSGSGKSTLLLVAGGLLHPTAGVVRIDAVEPYAVSADARARLRCRSIGFVFQQFHLVGYLTVRENILSASLGMGSSPDERRCDELIDLLGLSERSDHRPGKLSVGEKQRTALARALLNRPRLLLADEPTGNLDSENALRVLETLRAFAGDGGAVLLVTHDPRAAEYAHVRKELVGGRIGEPAVSC